MIVRMIVVIAFCAVLGAALFATLGTGSSAYGVY